MRANFTFAPTVVPGDFDISYGYSDLPYNEDMNGGADFYNKVYIFDNASKSIRGDEMNGGYLQL